MNTSASFSGRKGGIDTRPAEVSTCVGSYVGEQMNYQRIYDEFIADRRAKEPSVVASGVYTERHHILPSSLGGSNNKSNLIRLTYEDHVRAHLLLARIHGGAMWVPITLMVSVFDAKGRSITRPMRRALATARIKAATEFSSVIKAAYTRPDVKERHRAAINALHACPDYVEKRAAAIRLSLSTPEAKLKRSRTSIRNFSDQNVKDRHSSAIKRAFSSQEYRLKRSAISKAMHARPEVKQKRAEVMADPAILAKYSEGNKRFSALRAQFAEATGYTGDRKLITRAQVDAWLATTNGRVVEAVMPHTVTSFTG